MEELLEELLKEVRALRFQMNQVLNDMKQHLKQIDENTTPFTVDYDSNCINTYGADMDPDTLKQAKEIAEDKDK